MDISATTWNTVSKLLDEALDLEPADRAKWFDQLTATQPELATSVRKLLDAHASSETADVLAQLPSLDRSESAARVSSLAPGDRVGPYRLKREVGTGGMADVWLAERADGAFARDVALKLPLINRLRRDLALRFARERDILARLEHPHIARLYDAGVSDDGLPYLAMEYVDGQTITAYSDAHQLTVSQRLQLFAQVLDAVQYAHANLVIHRDLKPSNILVTADGQVRLLDFGIAKLLADSDAAHETQLTQLAGRSLTPDYASPEQIKGEPLTIATDVYSLGVVLYEMLAGQRPYQLKLESVAQLEQAIVATDPARPSSRISAEVAQARSSSVSRLAHMLSGDLDTIVLKALAKTLSQRYATIAEFGDDLRLYLAGKPVHARPASWMYRAHKFVIRNRLAVSAAAAVSVALIAATAVSLWQAQLAREQALRANEVKGFVLSIFQDADTLSGGSRKTTAVDLLQQARARLAATPVGDPSIGVELLTSIGFSLIGLGEYQEAAPVLEEATRLAVANLGEHHPNTIAAQLALGEALLQNSEPHRAAPLLDAAERGMRRTTNIAGLVRALGWQSQLQLVDGRHEEGISNATEAVKLAETYLATDKPALQQAYLVQAAAMGAIHRAGRLEPARKAYLLAQEIHGSRVTSVVLRARSLYAYALIKGDTGQGISELKALVPQQVELLGADHRDVSVSLQQIALVSMMRDDLPTAIGSLREALRIEAVHSGTRATNDAGVMRSNLGLALLNARRYSEAEVELRRANEIFAAIPEPNRSYVRMARANTGSLLSRTGRLAEADAVFEKLFEQPFGHPLEAAAIKVRLATLRTAQGQYVAAENLAREALEFLSQGPLPILEANATAALGAAQLEGGRAPAAFDTLLRARAQYEKLELKTSPAFADLLVNLARAQLALDRNDDAVVTSEQGVEFWNSFDRANSSRGIALLWHARALAAAGDMPKALDALRKADNILSKTELAADLKLLKQARQELRTRLRSPQ